MKSSVLSCVYEVVKAGDRELIYKLGSEIVYYKKIALHIFLAFGVTMTVSASEAIVFKRAYDILGAIVKDLYTAGDKSARDSG